MYKLAICDNCNQFLQNLNKEISIVLKELNWEYEVFIYKNGNIFLQEFQRHKFDLVFLDLEWLGRVGFDITEKLVNWKPYPLIIFCSNNEKLVFDCFKYQPFWFLCKDKYKIEVVN